MSNIPRCATCGTPLPGAEPRDPLLCPDCENNFKAAEEKTLDLRALEEKPRGGSK